MKQPNYSRWLILRAVWHWGLIALFLTECGTSFAQNIAATQSDSMTVAIEELQQQVHELRSAVAEVKTEAAQYRAETEQLRQELRIAQQLNAAVVSQQSAETIPLVNASSGPGQPAPLENSLDQRVASLEESSALLTSKVDEQHQVKVESASKYHVRLAGIALINLFSDRGSVDNQDVPSYAIPRGSYGSNGNIGATLRQSEMGLEVFGPAVAGARTSANVQVDFSGGFPDTLDGVNYGLVRLRTASMRMDWKDTSMIAGQDELFFSPMSPSSFASLAVPAFGYAGNPWGWIPQVRLERRFNFTDAESITVQGGILDNLTGQPPYSQFDRTSQAGESTGQPAYATRVSWRNNYRGRPFVLGAAAYYSRQNWSFNRLVDGWAGLADWNIPLPNRFSLSGEFYRGRAIGALGGGIGQSVVYSGDPGSPYTKIRGVNSAGGWTQLEFQATPKLELNGAFGLDNPFTRDLNTFAQGSTIYGAALHQNRNGLVNFIYRPRSNILFSAEYRHLRTLEAYNHSYTAEQVNLMMGVLF